MVGEIEDDEDDYDVPLSDEELDDFENDEVDLDDLASAMLDAVREKRASRLGAWTRAAADDYTTVIRQRCRLQAEAFGVEGCHTLHVSDAVRDAQECARACAHQRAAATTRDRSRPQRADGSSSTHDGQRHHLRDGQLPLLLDPRGSRPDYSLNVVC